MCVYLKKKLIKLLSSFFGMDFDMCPLLESDMIIPLYTSFNLNK
jgi:Mg2+ and Co2+ transporter CorA